MKTAGIVVLGIAVLVMILQAIFGGDQYGADKLGVVSNSVFVIASFLIGVGATLLLVDMNMRRQREGKTKKGSTLHDGNRRTGDRERVERRDVKK